MKRIRSIMTGSFLAVLIVCGGCSPKMRAQTEPGAIFSVPFAFTTNGHQVGAGTYEIRRLSNPFFISLRNVETGAKDLFSVRPEEQRKVPAKGLLVFHRCGQHIDLTEFHIAGTNLYSVAIPPRHARNSEIEGCSPAETMTVAAR
jgi:hypothetical protein